MKYGAFWRYCAATAATLSILVGSATAALAQQRDVTVIGQRDAEAGLSTRVSYRDLNLANASGERTLNGRVRAAARFVCSPGDDGFGLAQKRDHTFCLGFAMDGARPQVALAVQRAREIAATGTSNILPVAISIVAPR